MKSQGINLGLFGFFDIFKNLIKALFQFAVNDGSDVWVQIASALVNGLTEKSIDLSSDEIDITTQDSGKDKEFLSGQRSGVLTFGFKDDASDTYAYNQLFDAWKAGSSVAFAYGNGIKTTGGRVLSGNAIITGLTHSAPMNGEVSGTCTLRTTGAITRATSTTTVA
jgi:predicted secreted protein